MSKTKKVINLVTGGAGLIGSNLIKKLLTADQYVICLDDLSTGKKENLNEFENNKNFKFENHSVIKKYENKVDFIWHLASTASPYIYQKYPIQTSMVNFLGSYNMLNLAKENNARILLASTSEIYGECKGKISEEDNLISINSNSKRACYSNSKLLAETLFFDFNRIYKTDIRIARIFNSYGFNKNIYDGRVVSNFIVQALRDESLTIYGDGKQTRSFCYVSDTVDALILLMRSEYKQVINIGNQRSVSINQLAKLIISKINPKLTFSYLPKKEDEPINRCPSLKLSNKILGWEPKVNLDEGLDNTIEFYRNFLNI